jgi:hypothetical protein
MLHNNVEGDEKYPFPHRNDDELVECWDEKQAQKLNSLAIFESAARDRLNSLSLLLHAQLNMLKLWLLLLACLAGKLSLYYGSKPGARG